MQDISQKVEIRREVEEILDTKTKNEKVYLLIKWKGFKEKYNTWEKKSKI